MAALDPNYLILASSIIVINIHKHALFASMRSLFFLFIALSKLTASLTSTLSCIVVLAHILSGSSTSCPLFYCCACFSLFLTPSKRTIISSTISCINIFVPLSSLVLYPSNCIIIFLDYIYIMYCYLCF